MRFTAAALLCTAFLVGSFAAASADGSTPFEQAGVHLMLPSGWAEMPRLEVLSVDGFHKGDPTDPVQAFAWANPQRSVFVLVQVTSTVAQVPENAFRSNLTAMQEAIPASMGLTSLVRSSVTDDGTVMTGSIEGQMNALHVVMTNEGMVDSGRHLRAFSVMCLLREPVSDGARAACASVQHSFKVTLDRQTFLPLEPVPSSTP